MPLPDSLWIYEKTWDHWKGSPRDMGRLARRADEWMESQFRSFQTLPERGWYTPTGEVARQQFISSGHSVTIRDASTGVTADRMAEEVGARRDAVRIVVIQSSGTWRSQDVNPFDKVPLLRLEDADTPQFASEASVPPQRIEVRFAMDPRAAAVTLRVIAAGPLACASLLREMQPHVKAGCRKYRVWTARQAASSGIVLGAAVGVGVGLAISAPLGVGVGLLSALGLGVAGERFVRWAFPAFELVEDWERSRWDTARVYAWQGLGLVIALVAILLTIVLASPAAGGH